MLCHHQWKKTNKQKNTFSAQYGAPFNSTRSPNFRLPGIVRQNKMTHSPEQDSRHRKLKCIMQYILENITNPPTQQKMQFEGGNCFASVSDFTSVPKQTKIIAVSYCRSAPFPAFASPDLPTPPLRPGFILFFISRFHRQYAA